jgi:hypothetical protein
MPDTTRLFNAQTHADGTGRACGLILPAANKVVTKRFAHSAGDRGCVCEQRRRHGADLSNADLAGAGLAGADLHKANLSGANILGGDLSGANLIGANLGQSISAVPICMLPTSGVPTCAAQT